MRVEYGHVGMTPVRGTSPNVGFIPTTPVNCAGNPVGAAVVGAERRERHPARDRDRRAGARSAGRAWCRGVVRVEDLPGVTARAVAAIGEVVGGRLAEDDRAGSAQARDLERVAPNGVREEPRPLGARARGREPGHVVDRLGENRDTVERSSQATVAQACVGGAGVGERGVGQRVDGAPRSSLGRDSARARAP